MNLFQNKLQKQKNFQFYWMSLCACLILCMVIIGGVTRLTNSGLSIVEWKPVTGVIPPLSDLDWDIEFGKYKTSPEFILINNKMGIEDFKKIFWLEFIHRLAGRIVALVFFIPAITFWISDTLSKTTKKTIIIMSITGLFQGFMGWYMVKSGLSSSPYVSHFKLTFHLLLALVLFGVSVNECARLFYKDNYQIQIPSFNFFCIAITILQIALGGLVAGLDAGLIYNSFPLMGENFWPEELEIESAKNYLSNPAIVQFLHRINAYIVSFFIINLAVKALNRKNYKSSITLLFLILTQFLLGILTLIFHIPIFLASLHQITAFFLFAALILISRKL